jgi:hypothetical protein
MTQRTVQVAPNIPAGTKAAFYQLTGNGSTLAGFWAGNDAGVYMLDPSNPNAGRAATGEDVGVDGAASTLQDQPPDTIVLSQTFGAVVVLTIIPPIAQA